MATTGSIEVLRENGTRSDGLPVMAATDANVPTLLAAVFGYTAITKRTQKRAGAVGEWSATTPQAEAVIAILWPGEGHL